MCYAWLDQSALFLWYSLSSCCLNSGLSAVHPVPGNQWNVLVSFSCPWRWPWCWFVTLFWPLVLKKVKHRLVENMSSGTADALGLSRAILCNGKYCPGRHFPNGTLTLLCLPHFIVACMVHILSFGSALLLWLCLPFRSDVACPCGHLNVISGQINLKQGPT